MKIIAHIKTDFPTKFGLPRQSGLNSEIKGKIVFEKQYRNPDAFRGLEDFSHIWILWKFSVTDREEWSPTVRPPLLGGNKRIGVFATRSPFRPNPIGMSSVRLEKIEYTADLGPVLYVSGCDIMDNTPIYDIKPYLPYTDCHTDANGGFTDNLAERRLTVEIPEPLQKLIPEDKINELKSSLEMDPRPSYIDEAGRVYGFIFSGLEIKFIVENGTLTVINIL